MDKYLGFTFNGESLGMESNNDFNGFIKNDFEELAFNMPTFSNSFVTPTYGDKPFYLGNTKEHRTFDLDIVLNEITLDEYRSFLKWLGMDKKGILKFHYNLNYGYDVKLDSIGKANFVVVQQCKTNGDPLEDKYIIEIPITFITTGDWAARWVGTEVYWSRGTSRDLVDNEKETDFLDFSGNVITFNNKHNLPNYFILETDGEVIIEEIDGNSTEQDEWIIIPANTKFFSQYGIGTISNTFSEIVNSRIIEVPPMGTLTITLDEAFSSNITRITPTSREII